MRRLLIFLCFLRGPTAMFTFSARVIARQIRKEWLIFILLSVSPAVLFASDAVTDREQRHGSDLAKDEVSFRSLPRSSDARWLERGWSRVYC